MEALRAAGFEVDDADVARSFPPLAWAGLVVLSDAFATLNQLFNWMPGASLRDLQDAMGHASPRTTRRYDRSRGNLDCSPGYLLAGYISRAR